ncbi:Putative succinate-semialdehyde dehydrogenase [NADP(+)] 2 [Polystyrenella longa]|uniref:Succinate-semialdehyde dehydrogenase [NADP(+)] 2 n=1 Tax=Polystyrenella longa TaxID=2528007 RepID=A0A518CPK6_9PLAN|nr:aldehyde dehydrogenase family protein [Polystyrenella longa]QDU81148.1 Putative succinate-semialdehyde dehydrogenase [NADP(+)] 2 [Polystyrenella longa]
MLEIPVIRWGKKYESMEKSEVVHFETGEPMALVHQANGGLVKVDMRKAQAARDRLREIPIDDLIAICEKAGDLYLNAELPMGNGTQTPEEFCKIQSATTGLPEHMCASNMKKNAFVLSNMRDILDSMTRGLPFDVLTKGYGEEDRGVTLSYQAYSPVLGAVLPSNSPGVHTLWLPVIALQVGLVLKPGSSEIWTPFRIYEAFVAAGLPAEVFSIYPGPTDVGAAILDTCKRSMIFGGQQTIDLYAHNPNVQPHGPGFSKILLGDDKVDDWEKYVDLMADSIFANGGRSCINASGVWVSRHGKEIADAIAKKLGPVAPLPATDPKSALAASTLEGAAQAMNSAIEDGLASGETIDATAPYRDGDRLVEQERYSHLRPTVVYCPSPDAPLAKTEYMFPFASVVECPQDKMIKEMGTTLICTAITEDEKWSQQLLDATNIDRLNIGEVKTMAINWLQPHEGNLIEFLFRNRAYQTSPPAAH